MKHMKKNNKVTQSSVLHIQEIAHQKRSFSRIVLQIFVWILVIAFVSTIGVMWNGQGQGYPIIMKTKSEKVDLSPQSFYMLERDRVDEQLKENNKHIDPRVYNDYVNHLAFTNTERMILQQTFFDEINVKPSSKLLMHIQQSAQNMSPKLLEYQYGIQTFRGLLGILPTLGTPTISDMYAYHALKDFTITTEIIALNKTNFLISQISNEEAELYFQEKANTWANKVIVQDIIVSNRGLAKQIIKQLQEYPILENGLQFLAMDKKWQQNSKIEKNAILTPVAQPYTYFIESVKAYKNKNTNFNYGITEPIYQDGIYHVFLTDNIGSYMMLPKYIQYNMLIAYIQENYQKLNKKYHSLWKETVALFQKEIANKTSFAKIEFEVQGSVNNLTLPFSVVQTTISNIMGEPLKTPIYQNSVLLQEIINTPLNEISKIVSTDKSQEWLFAFKILEKNHPKLDKVEPSAALQQEIFYYKISQLEHNFGDSLKKRYKFEGYPDSLTNLINP